MQTECSENFLGCTYILCTINPILSTLCPSSLHIKVIKKVQLMKKYQVLQTQ